MTILIDVAAEFTGAKAFKQADKATNTLTKSALNLGKTLGITFGAAAVLGYAKASVQAAAKDQKAQKQLALALKNVGLERDAASAESYIQRLQSEFGVVDDLLRPAYQTLAIATRDTAETQKLLNLALDISAATSKDLGSVTSALSKAYLGSNTALSKLGVGISKADLKTKSFEEVTAQLAKTFKGAAAESAATFAGSIAKLGVASENVKEIIGKGIIDALMILGEDTSVSGLATDMESAATNAAALLVTLSKVIKTLSTPIVATSGALAWFIEKTSPFVDLIVTGDPTGLMGLKKPAPSKNPIQSGSYLNNSTSKTQLSVNKETLKVSKENLKLAKAKAIFDLSKIQIEAALKGKISEEERIRLLLLKAIQEENYTDIEKYTKMLDAVQGKVTDLEATLADVYAMDAGNPFVSWEIGLDGVQRALIEINGQSIELTNTLAQNSLAMGLMGGASFAQALSGARYAAQAAAAAGVTGTLGKLPDVPTGVAAGGSTTIVQVSVAGTVTAQADLERAIQDAINASNASGSANYLAPKTWRAEV